MHFQAHLHLVMINLQGVQHNYKRKEIGFYTLQGLGSAGVC